MSDLKERLRQLSKQLKEAQDDVEHSERQLKDAKARLRSINEDLFPGLMDEMGVKLLALDNGTVIKLEEVVSAAITEANRERAHAWLVANGYGGLIKTTVVAEFDAGHRDEAVSVAHGLAESHDHIELKEKVHPATLKAFVKERLTNGDNFPMELFSVHATTVAKPK